MNVVNFEEFVDFVTTLRPSISSKFSEIRECLEKTEYYMRAFDAHPRLLANFVRRRNAEISPQEFRELARSAHRQTV